MPHARPQRGKGSSLREGPEAAVPRAATADSTATGAELGLSRWRGEPIRKPRDARATYTGAGSGAASGDGLATRALSDGIRRAIVLPGDDSPRARPPGPGDPRKGAIRSHRPCPLMAHSTAPAPAVRPLALPSMAR